MLESPLDDHTIMRQTVLESVADRLRSMIVSRQLEPGERLVQSELAERLGVSRTPVREALHKLASEGLVTSSAHKGATVTSFSTEELLGVYSVRIALEGYGAYLAAQSISEEDLQQLEALVHKMKEIVQTGDRMRLLEVNREFYAVLFAATGQPRLCEMIMSHLDLAAMYRRLAFTLDSQYATTVAYHEELLATLWRRDSEAAENLARSGLVKTASDLITLLREHEEPSGQGEGQVLLMGEPHAK